VNIVLHALLKRKKRKKIKKKNEDDEKEMREADAHLRYRNDMPKECSSRLILVVECDYDHFLTG
jgi:hypothetical protein